MWRRDLGMIRSHGNVALSGHDHSSVLGDLCLLRLRLDGGEKKGRRCEISATFDTAMTTSMLVGLSP